MGSLNTRAGRVGGAAANCKSPRFLVQGVRRNYSLVFVRTIQLPQPTQEFSLFRVVYFT